MSNIGFKPNRMLQYGSILDVFELDNKTNQPVLTNSNLISNGATRLGDTAYDLNNNQYIFAKGYAGINQYDAVVIDIDNQAHPLQTNIKGKLGVCVQPNTKKPNAINKGAYFLIEGKVFVATNGSLANGDQVNIGSTPGQISSVGTPLIHTFATGNTGTPSAGLTPIAIHSISTIGDGIGNPIPQIDSLPTNQYPELCNAGGVITMQSWVVGSQISNTPFLSTDKLEVGITINGTPYQGDATGPNGFHTAGGTMASLANAVTWYNQQLVAAGSTAQIGIGSNGYDLYIIGSDTNPTTDSIDLVIWNLTVGQWQIKGEAYQTQNVGVSAGVGYPGDFHIVTEDFQSIATPAGPVPAGRTKFSNIVNILKCIFVEKANAILGAFNGTSIDTATQKVQLGDDSVGITQPGALQNTRHINLNGNNVKFEKSSGNTPTEIQDDGDVIVSKHLNIRAEGTQRGYSVNTTDTDPDGNSQASIGGNALIGNQTHTKGSDGSTVTGGQWVGSPGNFFIQDNSVMNKFTYKNSAGTALANLYNYSGVLYDTATNKLKTLVASSPVGEYFFGNTGIGGFLNSAELPVVATPAMLPTVENLGVNATTGQIVIKKENSKYSFAFNFPLYPSTAITSGAAFPGTKRTITGFNHTPNFAAPAGMKWVATVHANWIPIIGDNVDNALFRFISKVNGSDATLSGISSGEDVLVPYSEIYLQQPFTKECVNMYNLTNGSNTFDFDWALQATFPTDTTYNFNIFNLRGYVVVELINI